MWLMPTKFDFLSPGIEINEIDESVLPSDSANEGPIIIGRAVKGPGMQPVKIKTLSSFISVFGKPAPGGASEMGDVWRDGPNMSAPTYGAYAAQAWLASENSPITYVRLLGDQSSAASAGTNGEAGWQLKTSIPSRVIADNSTAYGLFIADNAAVSTLNYKTVTVSATIAEGNQYTVTDSDGNAVMFEADAGAGTTQTSTVRTFAQAGGINADALALASAIQDAVTAGYLNNIVVLKMAGTATFKLASSKGAGVFAKTTDTDPDVANTSFGTLTAPTNDALDGGRKGALAAVIYCDSGYLSLYNAETTANSAPLALHPSVGDSLKFGINVYKSDGTQDGGTKFFNFNKLTKKY